MKTSIGKTSTGLKHLDQLGLERSFQENKSHISTVIAGTLQMNRRYMAHEDLAHGQLTDKADVYSFGVLLLERLSQVGSTTRAIRTSEGAMNIPRAS
ncbi:hypothetical protein SAY87_016092 [Trapa incisa]|uniref:Protein kinase domain-containing protein n=1 Tax=Trapa incisa TaxID=236973 RepID=A0AAN7QX67_9MYRT|nr:hypothetical protein SAY87_016092 [Trapa incisa]